MPATIAATDTVTITVTAGPNDPPIADAGTDQTVAEGETVTLDGLGSSDPEGETLIFAWTPPTGVMLDDPTSATPGFTAPEQLVADNELEFSLVVSDASGHASAPDTVIITVIANNEAPSADAGSDQRVDEGAVVTLDATASSDPESEVLTFAWSTPTGVTLDDPASATPSFTAPVQLVADAELEFMLMVRDASGNSASDTVIITVTAGQNDAPNANAGPDGRAGAGATVTLNGTGSSDPEGEALSYAWIAPDDVILTAANTGTPSFSVPDDLENDLDLTFTLVVTDARGLDSAPNSVTITVIAGPRTVNVPPVPVDVPVDDIPPIVISELIYEGEKVELNAGNVVSNILDDDDDLTFSWILTQAPDGVDVELMSTGAILSFTVPDNLEGDIIMLEFTLTVTGATSSASGDAVPDPITLKVEMMVKVRPNKEPNVDAGDDQTVAEGATVMLDGRGSSDPEDDPLSFAWSGPDSVTLTGADTATPSFTAPTGLTENTLLTFTLTVTDVRNKAATGMVTITVTAQEVDLILAPISDFMLNRANALIENQPGLVRFLKQGAAADSPGFSVTKASQGRFGFGGSLGDDGIWGSLAGAWSESDASKSRHVFGALGKHKWYSDRQLVGIMLQFDMTDEEIANSRGNIDGTGWLAGPYFAARHSTQPLYFEGRLLWGQSYNQIRFQDPARGQRTSDFDSTRWLAQLRMEGEMSLGASRLLPYVDASWIEDSSSSFTDNRDTRVPGLTVRLGQLRLGSNIEIPVALKQGQMTITGGLGVTPSYTDNNSPDPALSQTRARADFGIDYKLNKNTYLNFDSHYDDIGVSDYKSFGLSFRRGIQILRHMEGAAVSEGKICAL